MASMKPMKFLYQAKNNTTGLADIKAQIYINGTAKAVGVSAIALTEVDATNSPGVYQLNITAANLTSWGVDQTTSYFVEGMIDSASHSAPAPFRSLVTVASEDDLDVKLGTPAGASVSADIAAVQTKLGTPAGASVSADIAAVKSDTAAIKVDLESGSASLATILSNIQALANGSISNGVGYVLPNMLIPASGSNTYKIPITIMNNDGALIDPTSNLVTVGVLNQAGTDRGSWLTGSSGSPATVSATKDSTGQYHVTLAIPSTAVEEELIFSFSYTVGSNAMVRYGQAQTLTDMGASGFALQSTLLTVKSDIEDATNGLAAIKTEVVANNTLLANGTYGLSALQTMLANGTYGLSALQTQGAASQGTGFVGATDSLHAISAYMISNLFTGGRAV